MYDDILGEQIHEVTDHIVEPNTHPMASVFKDGIQLRYIKRCIRRGDTYDCEQLQCDKDGKIVLTSANGYTGILSKVIKGCTITNG